jgi:hypothetical protein
MRYPIAVRVQVRYVEGIEISYSGIEDRHVVHTKCGEMLTGSIHCGCRTMSIARLLDRHDEGDLDGRNMHQTSNNMMSMTKRERN